MILFPRCVIFLKVMLIMCFSSNSLTNSNNFASSKRSSTTSKTFLAVCKQTGRLNEPSTWDCEHAINANQTPLVGSNTLARSTIHVVTWPCVMSAAHPLCLCQDTFPPPAMLWCTHLITTLLLLKPKHIIHSRKIQSAWDSTNVDAGVVKKNLKTHWRHWIQWMSITEEKTKKDTPIYAVSMFPKSSWVQVPFILLLCAWALFGIMVKVVGTSKAIWRRACTQGAAHKGNASDQLCSQRR